MPGASLLDSIARVGLEAETVSCPFAGLWWGAREGQVLVAERKCLLGALTMLAEGLEWDTQGCPPGETRTVTVAERAIGPRTHLG